MNKYSSIRCAGKVNRWSLNGMNALVTGGTRGIGHAIVEELCGLGATVHTCARNEDELGTCLRSWKDEGFTVSGSLCDVSSQVDRQKLMEVVSSTFNGKLNILVVDKQCGDKYSQSYGGFYSWRVFQPHGNKFWICFPSVSAGLSPFESIRGWKCCVHFFCLRFCLIEICLYKEQQKEQLINLQKIWHASGLKTTSGVMLLHLGTSKHPWWSK